MNYASTIAVITASIALAVSGWFATTQATQDKNIDDVKVNEATTQQAVLDIDKNITQMQADIHQLLLQKTMISTTK